VDAQPYLHPWSDADQYPAIYGQTEVSSVTFANFTMTQCAVAGDSQPKRDYAIAGHSANSLAADTWHPVNVSNLQFLNVDEASKAYLQRSNPGWINQGDCIDMDCDGPKVMTMPSDVLRVFSVSWIRS
jgi:hypothetical protein